MAKDYYRVLGIERGASAEEIQKAYRSLARKYHPDIAEDKDAAKQKFQEVQQAYDVLSDEKKKQMYDRYGADFEQMGGHPFGGGGGGGQQMDIDLNDLFGAGGPFGGNAGGGFEDILKQFGGGFAPGQSGFGGFDPHQDPRHAGRGSGQRHAQQTQAPPNLDLQQEVTVSFHTAVIGGQHQIALQRGSKVEEFTFKVPAGIEDGKKIRLRGQGISDPHSGQKGDLLIKINVAPHPCYRRSGKNLLVQLPIHYSEAARGAKVDLPTPHGTISITIPPGSSSHKTLRLKSMGVKTEQGPDGDLLVELQIVVPEQRDGAYEESLESLSQLESEMPIRNEIRW